jgi:hypothetical protein
MRQNVKNSDHTRYQIITGTYGRGTEVSSVRRRNRTKVGPATMRQQFIIQMNITVLNKKSFQYLLFIYEIYNKSTVGMFPAYGKKNGTKGFNFQ